MSRVLSLSQRSLRTPLRYTSRTVGSSLLSTRSYSSSRLAYPFGTSYSKPISSIKFLYSGATYRFFSSLPEHVVVGMPALSPSMSSGNIVSWEKKEGEEIVAGDVLAEVETDKAVMGFEATDDGYLAKILMPAGSSDIPIGKPIAVLVESEDDVAAFANFVPEEGATAEPAATPEPVAEVKEEAAPPPATTPPPPPATPATSVPQHGTGDRIIASPYAKSVASEKGIDLGMLASQGTGPNGRIIAADVQEFVPPPSSSSAPAALSSGLPSTASYVDLPLSQIRKVIAQRLTESKQTIPHYYLTSTIAMDNCLFFRQQFNEQADGQYKLSVNDFVIKASSLALQDVPECNSSWQESFIRQYNSVDINVAVSTGNGLFTPLIQNANHLGLAALNGRVSELAAKAKEGKLTPMELETGTFTISNLGMFGISQFSAVINPPQACILAVGGIDDVVVMKDEETKEVELESQMKVTLSCDHRVVDGAVGAQWLKRFKHYMEDPTRMLL